MKKVLSLLIAMIALFGITKVSAQDKKTETFKVSGNCNMCKKRIEKAATTDGVSKAEWNVKTKIMTVAYDASKTSSIAIQKKIAAVGHDTEKEQATDDVYNKLPDCCRYDRKGGAAHDHQHK